MNKQLDQFLGELLQQAHPTALPKPLLDKMKADLTLQLDQRLHDAILLALPEADQVAYQQHILQGTATPELTSWLTERIPDFSELTQYVCGELVRDYLAVCAE
ncbi:MAG: hypothetical protein ACD_41C00348G0021 [uncultured bacterium]|nr:MAG: hypothetical protein ACD_41C00348G0021 [uncultured bacterium]HBY74088.1 hypothetical protein [Candidatus Kerfeldbacteria bacterium]